MGYFKNMTNLVSMLDAIQAFEGQPKDSILKLGYGVIAGNLAYFFIEKYISYSKFNCLVNEKNYLLTLTII